MSRAKAKADRVPFDYYPTPPWCVHRLLDRHGLELIGTTEATLLEPSVGDGSIVRAVDEWVFDRHPTVALEIVPRWAGVELRRDAVRADTIGRLERFEEGLDFRAFDPVALGWGRSFERFDLALGNPPFTIAEAMIRKAMEWSDVVCFLLPLGFLASAERIPFWQGPGADPFLRILPNRPSFDGEGTDSATYAWFVWGLELDGPRVDVLADTPVCIRAAQKPTGTYDPRQTSMEDIW